MISLEEAVGVVLAGCRPLPPRRISLASAGGCVLASDVTAEELVPPFANTAMDGYAVRSADVVEVPVELPVVEEVAAGRPAGRPLGPGEAMRIFTGAPIPEGSDAIVKVESTERLDNGTRVLISESVAEGTHIRPAGDDIRPGDRVAAAGDELTPARTGLLRSLGVEEVHAHPRPWVGVLSTGDELVDGPEPLQPGQIRDTNRPTLLAMVAEAGFEPVDLGHVPDDEEAITRAIEVAAVRCDALLTSGGVSMGDTDLVKVVLDRLASDDDPMSWMQVAIKPSKPLAFGLVKLRNRSLPVFGLPGNPVSALVSFELFARAGVRKLAGHPASRLQRVALPGVAAEEVRRRVDGKIHFVRVQATVDGGQLVVRPVSGQGSHQLSGMAQANALAIVPDGSGVPVGSQLDVLLLNWC